MRWFFYLRLLKTVKNISNQFFLCHNSVSNLKFSEYSTFLFYSINKVLHYSMLMIKIHIKQATGMTKISRGGIFEKFSARGVYQKYPLPPIPFAWY